MFIKQVVLDGFKSYATRTVISDWDRHFTAITGLNGSGKSNILDAICFVLGLSNLSQVRVQNLQQLVYKEGQARVTRASVSIIFDNVDKDQSPIGYTDYDEITVTRQVQIGGRNKYMINGQSAQLSRVKDLFHSVQLDVNNPHFLIMQGRITKVLNMKPEGFLTMIQEAAGTKMYEEKKRSALKTLAKKQVKVNEIQSILDNEITPQLEKLRREKKHYIQWSENSTEIERLTKLVTSYKFFNATKELGQTEKKLQKKAEAMADAKSEEARFEEAIEELQQRIATAEAQREHGEGTSLAQLKAELSEMEKTEAGLKQNLKLLRGDLKKEKKQLKSIESEMAKAKAAIGEKEKEEAKRESDFGATEKRHAYLLQRIEQLNAAQLGVSTSAAKEGGGGSLQKQLMDARKQMTEAKSGIKQVQKKLDENVRKIAQKRAEMENFGAHAEDLDKQLEALRKKHAEFTEEIESLQPSARGFEAQERKLKGLEQDFNRVRSEKHALEREMQELRFDYDPPMGFDRSLVYGRVARLIELKAEHRHMAKCLQLIAGGRLYAVVVAAHSVGKTLLERGNLRKRVSIIPLDKIQTRLIPATARDAAVRMVGEGNVHVALELVCYEQRVEKAIENVFGTAFACRSSDEAKRVAFDRATPYKCVTVDGDVYDPRGTLQGGANARDDGEGILLKLDRFQGVVKRERELHATFDTEKKEFKDLEKAKERVEALEFERALVGDRIKGLETQKLESDFNEKKQEIEALEKGNEKLLLEKDEFTSALQLAQTKIRDLDKDIKASKSSKNSAKRTANEIRKCRKELDDLNENKTQSEMIKTEIEEEIDAMCGEIQGFEKDATESATKALEMEGKCTAIDEEIKEMVPLMAEKKAAIATETARLEREFAVIKRMANERKAAEKSQKNAQKKQLKLEKEAKRIQAMAVRYSDIIRDLKERHAWIATESEEFGRNGSAYDYSKTKPDTCAARLRLLRKEQTELKSLVNHKVMAMFERAESEYRALVDKRRIILDDKRKIEKVIQDLDLKKEATLDTTWRKVSDNFGRIFSKLLSGVQCRLQPVDGDSNAIDVGFAADGDEKEAATEELRSSAARRRKHVSSLTFAGFEIRVAFGDVWKESLTELSGGQRSLCALSLILALLLFKPAPMYILDEIDAALDLSHTQNIGRMLRAYFSKSQFIVVSLKENMFQNANVVFKTKFVDGVSTVKRTLGLGRKGALRKAKPAPRRRG